MYRGYGIGFDPRSQFLLPDGSVGKNVIMFGVDMKNILILGEYLRIRWYYVISRSSINFQLIFQDQIEHFV